MSGGVVKTTDTSRIETTVDDRSLRLQVDRLVASFDAQAWAEFVKRAKANPAIEGTMLTWFANAIMAGYDHARRELSEGKNT